MIVSLSNDLESDTMSVPVEQQVWQGDTREEVENLAKAYVSKRFDLEPKSAGWHVDYVTILHSVRQKDIAHVNEPSQRSVAPTTFKWRTKKMTWRVAFRVTYGSNKDNRSDLTLEQKVTSDVELPDDRVKNVAKARAYRELNKKGFFPDRVQKMKVMFIVRDEDDHLLYDS